MSMQRYSIVQKSFAALALASLVVTIIGVVVLFVCPAVLAEFWQGVSTAMLDPQFRAGAIIAVIVMGGLFYFAKKLYLCWYGLTEVMVGIAACWVGLGEVPKDMHTGLSLTCGIYIMVRGLADFAQGLDRKERKPLGYL